MTQDDRIVVPINNIMKWLYCPMQIYIHYFIGREYDNVSKNIVKEGHEYHGIPINRLSDEQTDELYFGGLSKEEYNKKYHNKKQIKKFTKKQLTDSKKGIDKLIKAKYPCEKRRIVGSNGHIIVRMFLNKKDREYEKYWAREILIVSEKLKIIGKLDEIHKEDNEWILVEKKSQVTSYVYQDWKIQCNAYLYCLEELGLNINRYKIITPINEFYGTYDESIIKSMKTIIDKIRYVVTNRQMPTYNLSGCTNCCDINICKSLIKQPTTDFKPKKIKLKDKLQY